MNTNEIDKNNNSTTIIRIDKQSNTKVDKNDKIVMTKLLKHEEHDDSDTKSTSMQIPTNSTPIHALDDDIDHSTNRNNVKHIQLKTFSTSTSNKKKSSNHNHQNNSNKSRSSFKLYNHSNSNDKHELANLFKKNRSLSHSYTTKDNEFEIEHFDVDHINSNDADEEEEELDEDDINESTKLNISKIKRQMSSPAKSHNYMNNSHPHHGHHKKSIMEDVMETITSEVATAGAITAGVPSHGVPMPTMIASTTSTTSKTGSSTLSSNSNNHEIESSSLSSTSNNDHVCSISTSDLSMITPKINNLKETSFKVIVHEQKDDSNNVKDENNNNENIVMVEIIDAKKRYLIRNRHPSTRDSKKQAHEEKIKDDNRIISNKRKSTSSEEIVTKNKKSEKSQLSPEVKHKHFLVFLLFVVNLLNYIDRYTLAGILTDVQKYFNINDGEGGLLQTVFICSYMLLAPLFGYMGDRYSRKWIIIFGISFWSMMTLLGSFIPADKFWLFAIIRSLVGIGEASYSCVAPTIIGDLFTKEERTRMLAFFYLAVPVGSGMGYIVGSNVATAFSNWKWALRITPPLGFVCIIFLAIIFKDPKRGAAEGTSSMEPSNSSMWQDIVYLIKNKTFIWITLGFTFASFVLGGLSWWVPTFVELGIKSNNEVPVQIGFKFGAITATSGLFGVVASSVLSSRLRTRYGHADPLICALGSLIACPSLFFLILIARVANQYLFWMLSAVAITAMCLSWTIVADILLYAIYPSKRSIASAFNILIVHLFGDAGSPYVIGLVSDALRAGKPDTYYNKFTSLQMALYAGPFFAAVSFACYLFAGIYVEEDKKIVEDFIKKNQKPISNDSNDPAKLNSSNENSHKEEDDEEIGNNSNDLGQTQNNNNKSSITTTNEINANNTKPKIDSPASKTNNINNANTNINFTDSRIDMQSSGSEANLLKPK